MYFALLSFIVGISPNVEDTNPLISGVNKPIVISVGAINDEMAKRFSDLMDAAQTTGQTVIPVVINSYGGSVYSLIEMIDAIRASKIPVATICVGKCMSAGAVLLAMGANGMRYAAPNATIMVHEVSGGADGKVGEMTATVDEANRLNALMFKFMSLNIGKPANYFKNLITIRARVDWFMTSKDALSIGIINKIGVPKFNVKVKVETVLE